MASGLSVSAESVKTLLRRTSSRDKERDRSRRGSGRKNKENGKKQQSITEDQQHEHQISKSLAEVRGEDNIHITYKPRIWLRPKF